MAYRRRSSTATLALAVLVWGCAVGAAPPPTEEAAAPVTGTDTTPQPAEPATDVSPAVGDADEVSPAAGEGETTARPPDSAPPSEEGVDFSDVSVVEKRAAEVAEEEFEGDSAILGRKRSKRDARSARDITRSRHRRSFLTARGSTDYGNVKDDARSLAQDLIERSALVGDIENKRVWRSGMPKVDNIEVMEINMGESRDKRGRLHFHTRLPRDLSTEEETKFLEEKNCSSAESNTHRSKRESGSPNQKNGRASGRKTGRTSKGTRSKPEIESNEGQKNKTTEQPRPGRRPSESRTTNKSRKAKGEGRPSTGNNPEQPNKPRNKTSNRPGGRAVKGTTEQTPGNKEVQLQKRPRGGQRNKTQKIQTRARRPRDLTVEETGATEAGVSRRGKRGMGSPKKKRRCVPVPSGEQGPKNGGEPRGSQNNTSPNSKKLSRRRRDLLKSEESEEDEDDAGPSTESLPQNDSTAPQDGAADEPALQFEGNRDAKEERSPPEYDSSSFEEVQESTASSNTVPATESPPGYTVQPEASAGSDDSSDRRRRQVPLQEEEVAENLREADTSEALHRPKRQQMGFLHYRKANPAAFSGKPYTGRPWPKVSRRPNQGQPQP